MTSLKIISLSPVANVVVVLYVAAVFVMRRYARTLKIITACFLVWAAFYFAVEGVIRSNLSPGVDFASYLVGNKELLAGRDPYADFAVFLHTRAGPVREILAAHDLELTPPVMYPPPFYVLLTPLFWFSYPTAFATWSVVNALLLIAAAWLAYRAFDLRGGWSFVAVLALALAASPSLDNLYEGQANILLALAIAGVAWGVTRARSKTTGFIAAGAILLKLFPAVFLVYFALRRRWRELIWAAAILAAVTLAVAAVWGPALWANYARLVAFPVTAAAPVMAVNVSPVTMLAQVLPPGAPEKALVTASKWAALIFFFALLFYLRRPRLEGAAEIGLLTAAAMVASGWVTQPHLVVLILPYVFLGREIWERRASFGAALLATLSFISVMLRYDYRRFDLAGWPTTLLMAVKPLGLVLLVGALLWHAAGERRRRPA